MPEHSLRVARETFLYGHPLEAVGILETAVLDVYHSSRIQRGWTVLDIGAGIGDFAVVASRRVGPSGKVIAIEPAAQDFAFLQRNLARNRCRNVIAVQAAISNREVEGVIEFKGVTTRVRTRALRDLLSELGVEPQRIRFVKLDIEGAEKEVVPDSLRILSGCERIAIELHDGAGEILDPMMQRIGFVFRRLSRGRYLWKAASFCLRHPVQSVSVFRAVRQSDAYHGILKFLRGMAITNSEELVVGSYIRSRNLTDSNESTPEFSSCDELG